MLPTSKSSLWTLCMLLSVPPSRLSDKSSCLQISASRQATGPQVLTAMVSAEPSALFQCRRPFVHRRDAQTGHLAADQPTRLIAGQRDARGGVAYRCYMCCGG